MSKKKEDPSWRTKAGQTLKLKDMTDSHLINSIKMVARACNNPKYLGKMIDNPTYLKLTREAMRREYTISIYSSPTLINGRNEYVDVYLPHPSSSIKAGFFQTDWDSRPME